MKKFNCDTCGVTGMTHDTAMEHLGHDYKEPQPTQAKPEHTPYQVLQGQTVRGTPDAFTISHALDNGSEDVKAFIVRAVNAHQELLAALRDGQETICQTVCDAFHCDTCVSMTQAIAKAEGKANG